MFSPVTLRLCLEESDFKENKVIAEAWSNRWITTRRGFLMGKPGGWAVLNLANLFAAQFMEWKRSAGDDLIGYGDSESISIYKTRINGLGFSLNDDKSYVHPNKGIYCEHMVKLSTITKKEEYRHLRRRFDRKYAEHHKKTFGVPKNKRCPHCKVVGCHCCFTKPPRNDEEPLAQLVGHQERDDHDVDYKVDDALWDSLDNLNDHESDKGEAAWKNKTNRTTIGGQYGLRNDSSPSPQGSSSDDEKDVLAVPWSAQGGWITCQQPEYQRTKSRAYKKFEARKLREREIQQRSKMIRITKEILSEVVRTAVHEVTKRREESRDGMMKEIISNIVANVTSREPNYSRSVAGSVIERLIDSALEWVHDRQEVKDDQHGGDALLQTCLDLIEDGQIGHSEAVQLVHDAGNLIDALGHGFSGSQDLTQLREAHHRANSGSSATRVWTDVITRVTGTYDSDSGQQMNGARQSSTSSVNCKKELFTDSPRHSTEQMGSSSNMDGSFSNMSVREDLTDMDEEKKSEIEYKYNNNNNEQDTSGLGTTLTLSALKDQGLYTIMRGKKKERYLWYDDDEKLQVSDSQISEPTIGDQGTVSFSETKGLEKRFMDDRRKESIKLNGGHSATASTKSKGSNRGLKYEINKIKDQKAKVTARRMRRRYLVRRRKQKAKQIEAANRESTLTEKIRQFHLNVVDWKYKFIHKYDLIDSDFVKITMRPSFKMNNLFNKPEFGFSRDTPFENICERYNAFKYGLKQFKLPIMSHVYKKGEDWHDLIKMYRAGIPLECSKGLNGHGLKFRTRKWVRILESWLIYNDRRGEYLNFHDVVTEKESEYYRNLTSNVMLILALDPNRILTYSKCTYCGLTTNDALRCKACFRNTRIGGHIKPRRRMMKHEDKLEAQLMIKYLQLQPGDLSSREKLTRLNQRSYDNKIKMELDKAKQVEGKVDLKIIENILMNAIRNFHYASWSIPERSNVQPLGKPTKNAKEYIEKLRHLKLQSRKITTNQYIKLYKIRNLSTMSIIKLIQRKVRKRRKPYILPDRYRRRYLLRKDLVEYAKIRKCSSLTEKRVDYMNLHGKVVQFSHSI
jgi:hypothetical protein